ncbi:hypothetical protein GCM10023149_27630 [Mucilaginibacter gynuensis]|uniref:DUF4920 domain-containing protein n=1 Tax=Mucilaginibacter gynuensis TaxID=1302236 RepID=A0ABP8GJ76_9SPHI
MKLSRVSLVLSLLLFCFAYTAHAQNAALPHGMIYGTQPDTAVMMDAPKLREFMGKKTRITTAIKGKVIKVTKAKGGWFELDAGNGEIITAHFSRGGINLPLNIKDRVVIIDGVAKKNFIADDEQHFAGDTTTYKTHSKELPRISFEVKGLMVYQ